MSLLKYQTTCKAFLRVFNKICKVKFWVKIGKTNANNYQKMEQQKAELLIQN